MTCDKCKAHIPDSAVSCPECGSKAGPEVPEEATKTCPRCGAVNPAAAKFCMEDGYNFEETAKPRSEDRTAADVTLRCPLCGTKYPEGIKFCRKDGMPLEPLARKTPPPDSPPPPPAEAIAVKPPRGHAKEEPEDGTIYVGSLRNTPISFEAERTAKEPNDRELSPPSDVRASSASTREPARRVEARGGFPEESAKTAVQGPAFEAQDRKAVEEPESRDSQVRNTVRCPKCGTMNPEGALYCKNDGIVLEAQASPATGGKTEESVRDLPLLDAPVNPASTEARSEISFKEQPASRVQDAEAKRPETLLEEQPASQVQVIKEARGSEADYTVRCPTCGTMNPEEANFCRKDGTPLKGQQASPAAGGEVPASEKLEKSPARMRASAPVTKSEKPKGSRMGLWITLSIIVLVLAGAGGLLYYKGFSGMRPGALQAVLNQELKGKGLNVTAEISKDWTAILNGSVRQQAEKDLALTTVTLHKEVKSVTDNIVLDRTPAAVQADIQKGLTERGLTAVQAQVDENFVVTLTGTVYGENEKTAAIDIGRGVNGVKDVQNMVTVKVEKQQAASPSASEKSKAAKAKAAAKRDSSKMSAGRLEGEINRALRNAGISGVSAEVKDDMGAVVKGSVRSAGDKQKAMQIVQGFRQIRNVRDIVFVIGQ